MVAFKEWLLLVQKCFGVNDLDLTVKWKAEIKELYSKARSDKQHES